MDELKKFPKIQLVKPESKKGMAIKIKVKAKSNGDGGLASFLSHHIGVVGLELSQFK
jgi:hypothetical protein